MPRTIKVRNKTTGKVHSFEWDKDANPTQDDIRRLTSSTARPAPEKPYQPYTLDQFDADLIKNTAPPKDTSFLGRLRSFSETARLPEISEALEEPYLPLIPDNPNLATPLKVGRDIYNTVAGAASPVGLATLASLPYTAIPTGLVSAYYGGKSLLETPGMIERAVEEPSYESVRDATLTSAGGLLGAAGVRFAAKGGLNPKQPKLSGPRPSIELPRPTARPLTGKLAEAQAPKGGYTGEPTPLIKGGGVSAFRDQKLLANRTVYDALERSREANLSKPKDFGVVDKRNPKLLEDLKPPTPETTPRVSRLVDTPVKVTDSRQAAVRLEDLPKFAKSNRAEILQIPESGSSAYAKVIDRRTVKISEVQSSLERYVPKEPLFKTRDIRGVDDIYTKQLSKFPREVEPPLSREPLRKFTDASGEPTLLKGPRKRTGEIEIIEPIKQEPSNVRPVIMENTPLEAASAAEGVFLKAARGEKTDIPASFLVDKSPKVTGSLEKVGAYLGKSQAQVVKDQGPTGRALDFELKRTRADAFAAAGRAKQELSEAIKGLTKEELGEAKVVVKKGQPAYKESVRQGNFIDVVDSNATPMNEAVARAVQVYRRIDNQLKRDSKVAEIGLRAADGTIVPFTPREFYFPHYVSPEIVKAITKHPKARASFLQSLVAQGMSTQQATAAIKRIKGGERLISAQHAREMTVPFWDRKIDRVYDHFDEMYRRVEESKTFGPKDLGDPASPLSQALNRIAVEGGNADMIRGIMQQRLGKQSKSIIAEQIQPAQRQITRAVASTLSALHLPFFTVTNMKAFSSNISFGTLPNFTRSLMKYITDHKKSVKIAEESGSLGVVRTRDTPILSEAGLGVSRFYRIPQSERFQRTVSAVQGQAMARKYFHKLQRNPKDAVARTNLEDLTLTSVDDSLKRGQLSKQELDRAGFRMSELTQGIAEPFDLPSAVSQSPLAEHAFMYRRFAFRTLANYIYVLKRDKRWKGTRAPGMALFATQLVAEIISDASAFISGGLEEVKSRGMLKHEGGPEFTPEWLGKRAFNNLVSSFALGVLEPFVRGALRGKEGIMEAFAPATIGTAAQGYKAATQLAKGKVRPTLRMSPIGRAIDNRVNPRPKKVSRRRRRPSR